MCVTICKLGSQWKLYDAGSSNPQLCDYLEKWDGIEGEGGSRGRGHMHTCG